MRDAQYLRANDTEPGYSPAIWGLWDDDMPEKYLTFEDHFTELLTGRYTATQAGAGTFALTDAVGGVAIADTGNATENNGINVQQNIGTGEWVKAAAGKKIFFEARVKFVTVGGDLFLGLAPIDTALVTSHAMHNDNYLGFQCLNIGTRVITGCGNKAAASTTTTVNGGTALTLDTYYKLGFVVDGVKTVTFYCNGTKEGTANALATANIPIVEMLPSLVNQNYTTSRCYVHIDWWRVSQEL